MTKITKEILDRAENSDKRLLVQAFFENVNIHFCKAKRELEQKILEGNDIEKLRTKILKDRKLKLLFKLMGEDFEKELNKIIEPIEKQKNRIENVNLETPDGALKAWLEVYVPNGGQPTSFYRNITNAFYKHFDFIRAGGYYRDSNQGGVQMWLDRSKDFDLQYEEIKKALKYIKPISGKKYIDIMTEDCSEYGVASFYADGKTGVVDFTRYHNTTEKFRGTIKEAIKYVWNNYYYTNGSD